MSLKRQVRNLFGIQIALAIGLAILVVALFLNQTRLSRSQVVRSESYLVADELRQSSDDLSRMARAFVATGDERFARQYQAVLDIRNGKRSRPTAYNRIYWDLVLRDGEQPRPDGVPVPLQELIRSTGVTGAELGELAQAQKNSDELAKVEEIAMNAVRGLYADSTGGFTVRKAPDRAMAMRMLHDGAYFERKAQIMRPIDDFFVLLAERTAGAVAENERRSTMLLWSLGALIVAIMGMFAYSFVTIRRQIVRREDADRALHESQERHRTILQTAIDGFWVTDTEGRLLEVNDTYSRMSGYSEQDLLGMRISDLDAEETADETIARIERLVAQGESRFESRHRRKDGTTFDVAVSAQWQPVDGGRLVVFLQDITARRRAEEARRIQSEELDRYFTLSLDLLCIADVGGHFVRVNPEWEKLLGYSLPELEGRSFLDLVHPDDMVDTLAAMSQLSAQKRVLSFENRYRGKDGSYHWIEWRSTPHGDLVYAAARDITARKQATAALQDQLLQAQKMESIGRLAGGVAHDFNNMLGVILGNVEFALQQAEKAPLRSSLEEVKKAAERSAGLTAQLLAFASRQMVLPEVQKLNDTMTGLLSMLQRLIGEDVSIVFEPAADLWLTAIDPSQMASVVTNLAVNARHAITDVGTLTIATANCTVDAAFCAVHADAALGEYVRLTVSDTGCGMDEATRARIFEPFFTTREVGEGVGLGLASVYGAVRQNDGFVTVSSAPGQGSTFEIYLPRHLGEVQAAEAPVAAAPGSGGHETILLVEDELGLLNVAAKVLVAHGYTVLPANSPGEAVRKAAEHEGEIQLLLTDVVMPGMNGRELGRTLSSARPRLRSILMSGFSADMIAKRGLMGDGADFLQKPFSADALAAKVRSVLDRA